MLKIIFQTNIKKQAYSKLEENGFYPIKEDSGVFLSPLPMYEMDEKDFCRMLSLFGTIAVEPSWDKSKFDFRVILLVDEDEKKRLENSK